MAGCKRIAAPGEPTCGVHGCPRPAGFATRHAGRGPCLRHGGAKCEPPKRSRTRRRPPGWKRDPDAAPFATVLTALETAKRQGQPFPLAWADALYDALDGLGDREFTDWADVMLTTSRAWADAYADEPSPVSNLSIP